MGCNSSYHSCSMSFGKRSRGGAKNPLTFERESLDQHNRFRRMHGVPPVRINKNLTAVAQDWANHLSAKERFYHRNDLHYGENLYMISYGKIDGREPVKSWYSEISDYDFNKPRFSKDVGHFTQVVWKNTEQIGTGFATDNRGRTYVVTNYYPRGNRDGKYSDNVPRPRNM